MSSDSQNGSPKPEYLSLADLSPELQINALRTLACPVIAILPDGEQLGSGVLVDVDGESGILTGGTRLKAPGLPWWQGGVFRFQVLRWSFEKLV